MESDELLPELLREVAKIGANQEHLMNDIAEIKNSLSGLRTDNCKRDKRINDLELHNAKQDGEHKVVLGLLSLGAAFVSALLTAFITQFWR